MNDTTPQPERAVTLQPKRPGAILGAAFELYQRQLLTLIAIAAVLVVPSGILNWRQWCSNGACRITILDGEVVSTSFWATPAWVLVAPIALLALCAVVLAVTTRAVTAQLTTRTRACGRASGPLSPDRGGCSRSSSWSSVRWPCWSCWSSQACP